MSSANSRDLLCILGMHRSGTSCLTGSLQQCGLQLGKHHTWNPFNQRGNRENQDIVDFHDQLLAKSGSSWDSPPRRYRFDATDVVAAREMAASLSGPGAWGFKDPRALLVLPLWLEAIPDMRYAGIFRHPRSVAQSLSSRSGGEMSLEQGYGLWLEYNQRLYDFYRREQFPLLCFDWPEEQFHRKLNLLIDELGLPQPPEGERFYTPDLRNSDTSDWSGVPWRARWLYRKLQKITL